MVGVLMGGVGVVTGALVVETVWPWGGGGGGGVGGGGGGVGWGF